MTRETGASQELVLLAVRKSPHTRTVTGLQLPESVHLPRWFQAELTSTESACLTQSGPFTSFLWNPEWQLKHIGPPVQRSRWIRPNHLRFHLGAQMCVRQASGHCAGAWNSNGKGAQVLCESALVCSTFFVDPPSTHNATTTSTNFVRHLDGCIDHQLISSRRNSTKEPGAKPLKQDRDTASTNMTCHKLAAVRDRVVLDQAFNGFAKTGRAAGTPGKARASQTQGGNRTDQDLASRNSRPRKKTRQTPRTGMHYTKNQSKTLIIDSGQRQESATPGNV